MVAALTQECLGGLRRVLHGNLHVRMPGGDQFQFEALQSHTQDLDAEVSTVCGAIYIVLFGSSPNLTSRLSYQGSLLLVQVDTDLRQVAGTKMWTLQEVVETMHTAKAPKLSFMINIHLKRALI